MLLVKNNENSDNKGIVKLGNVFIRSKIRNPITIQLEPFEALLLNDPQYIVEYSKDIFDNLLQFQKTNTPKHGYMVSMQTKINEKMRAILIDWLIEVHFKFKLLPETLFLCVNLIDRYLSVVKIEDTELQLLGTAAMVIAAKYEEIYAPEIRDFIYITDRQYNKDSILKMESKILAALQFDILSASSFIFLERFFLVAGEEDKIALYLAQYLIELSLLEYKMLHYSPSIKAASALYLARKILKIFPNAWTNSLQFHSSHKEDELINCAKDLCQLLEFIPKVSLRSLFKKFSSKKYGEIAIIIYQKYKKEE